MTILGELVSIGTLLAFVVVCIGVLVLRTSNSVIADAAQLASLADETPEGRSIVVLAKQYGLREHGLVEHEAEFVPFTAQTRMSGVDLDGRTIRKGAAEAVAAWVASKNVPFPSEVRAQVDTVARRGSTPLVVAEAASTARVLGVIGLAVMATGTGWIERLSQKSLSRRC